MEISWYENFDKLVTKLNSFERRVSKVWPLCPKIPGHWIQLMKLIFHQEFSSLCQWKSLPTKSLLLADTLHLQKIWNCFVSNKFCTLIIFQPYSSSRKQIIVLSMARLYFALHGMSFPHFPVYVCLRLIFCWFLPIDFSSDYHVSWTFFLFRYCTRSIPSHFSTFAAAKVFNARGTTGLSSPARITGDQFQQIAFYFCNVSAMCWAIRLMFTLLIRADDVR